MGRAGRFGTKGLAITFVSSASDSEVLNQVWRLLNILSCYGSIVHNFLSCLFFTIVGSGKV